MLAARPPACGRRRFAALLLLGFAFACSADAVEVPEPAVEQPGTFVATPLESGRFRLFRIRNSIVFDPQRTYLFLDEYVPGAANLTEARRLAQNADIPLRPIDVVVLQDFLKTPHFVVWYRSLDADERD